MNIEPLSIEGAWSFHPKQFRDDRGVFMEWYRHEAFAEFAGHRLELSQANCSVSQRNTVRGIHFADVPPGQAKYVTCVRGAVMDVVVDLRLGSATFGSWEAIRLDDESRAAVYLSEGLGHGFAALSDDATVVYLCSTVYNPGGEHGVHPLDPELAIDWTGFGIDSPLISPKDAAAPTLALAKGQGLLPDDGTCREYRRSLEPSPLAGGSSHR